MTSLCDMQRTMYGANVVIFEGIMSFTSKELRDVSFIFLTVQFLLGQKILTWSPVLAILLIYNY